MMNIEELANQLKLTYIRDNMYRKEVRTPGRAAFCEAKRTEREILITEARHKQQDYAEFLEMLLTHETEKRTNNRYRKIAARRFSGAFFARRKIVRYFKTHQRS